VDELWDRLSQGGEKSRCGWLKDKYGLSWQVVPIALMELINDPDPEKSKRVVEAMLQMTKIDVAKLKAAHAG
jgi:predicted 3-demethylubiquinone-9 3-methyltransferase (glyoxalase superfamily)